MVNLQGFFLLIVGTTKYYNIIETVYFIDRLFMLFLSTFSFMLLFYNNHGGMREITPIPVWTYRSILCSILST